MGTEKKHDIAFYDVKDVIGKDTMEWVRSERKLYDISEDWEALSPLRKLCIYWLMYYECDVSRIKDFDCDSSEYVKDIFDSFTIRVDAPSLAPCMDTMTSAWSPIRKYLNLNGGKRTGIKLLLENHDFYGSKLESIGAIRFLEVNHTIGNFIPVPKYFNVSRAGWRASYDQADLMLRAIYDYYDPQGDRENGKGNDHRDDSSLTALFSKSGNNKDNALHHAKLWLDHFGTWTGFVEDNCLKAMVEDGCSGEAGVPIMFFPDHSLDKPYPDSEEEWRQWFNTAAELIEKRSVDIAGHIVTA